jgi:hypothetical protein
VPGFFIGRYEARFCFAPQGHGALWWFDQILEGIALLSILGAIAGLIWDKEKSVAAVALVFWFPACFISLIVGGCP